MTQFADFCGREQFQPEVFLEPAVEAENVGFDALTVSTTVGLRVLAGGMLDFQGGTTAG
jgi:hypothetical protein